MLHSSFEKRRARSGRGLLPPNPKRWGVEHNGLDLRDELGVEYDSPLGHADAYELLPQTLLVPHGELPAAAKYLAHVRDRSGVWSGMAIPVADGTIVVYNDSHPLTRTRATVMEEFFHIWLGHPPTRLRYYAETGQHRTYNSAVEDEAYGSGAAALVPYAGLRKLVSSGATIRAIASHFQVSQDLVQYRCAITRTWSVARSSPRRT